MRQRSSRVGLKDRETEREGQKENGVESGTKRKLDRREMADKREGEDSDRVGRSKKDG